MSRVKLTDRLIRSLITDKAQEDFWDNQTPGLGLRVTSSGRKTFFCRYRIGQSQRRMNLGEFPGLALAAARTKYRSIHNQVDEGSDPQLEKRQAKLAESVGELFETFFADREGRIAEVTLKKYRAIYRLHFEKPLGSVRASDLRKAHVIPILRAMAVRTPTQCERAQELIQACFNHGVALDLIEFNPLHKLPSFGETRVGERHLSAAEIEDYLKAADTLPVVERVYFHLLILYGTRPGELAQWQWKWIKDDRVMIPGEFQKNSRALTLPITPNASRLLSELNVVSGDTMWLFPNPARDGWRMSFRKHRLRMEKKMSEMELWTLRDIRRTVETQLRELRVSSDIVASILNHNTSHLRKIYDKSENLSEKKRALFKYEKYLLRLKTQGAQPKVVSLAGYR